MKTSDTGASLAHLANMLKTVGYDRPVTERCLSPGNERCQLFKFLLSRLTEQDSVDTLLDRLPTEDYYDNLTEEEEVSHRMQVVLKLLGFNASPDVIRGCGDLGKRVHLLEQILVTLLAQQQCSSTNDRTTNTHMAASSSKLLSIAADKFPLVVSGPSTQLFPSDILDNIESECDIPDFLSLSKEAARHSQILRERTDSLKAQGEPLEEEEWWVVHQDTQSEVNDFLRAADTFSSTFQKELLVWCQSVKPPGTAGVGPLAADVAELQSKFVTLMRELTQIRHAYDTLHSMPHALQVGLRQVSATLEESRQGLDLLHQVVSSSVVN